MKIGDRVKTRTEKVPYYSGYGGRPTMSIPAGTYGTVGAVDVAAVRHIPGNPPRFLCLDFTVDGVAWRGAYYPDEVQP